MYPIRRRFLTSQRGSALILVVLLTLVLAAMSIVALRDIARTTSQTAVYRTRTQAQMTSNAAARIFTNYAGANAGPMFEAANATLYGENGDVLGIFGENEEGLDADDDGTVTRTERRATTAVVGPVLTFDHRVLTSDCDGLCPQMIPHPGGDETGLFRSANSHITFETRRTTEWGIVARDFTDGYPAVGYGEGFCFKKALVASQSRVGVPDPEWTRANNVGHSRHGVDAVLGPVRCGYN